MTLTTNLSLPGSTHNQQYIHIHNLYNEPDTSNSLVLDDLTTILSQTSAIATNPSYEVTTHNLLKPTAQISNVNIGIQNSCTPKSQTTVGKNCWPIEMCLSALRHLAKTSGWGPISGLVV